jgi:maltose O-acetyltransferase
VNRPLTEREKMLAGLPYHPGDRELAGLRRKAQSILRAYNATICGEDEARGALLGALLGSWNGAVIRPPFHVDYGCHIHFAEGVFVNFGCVVLDVCEVRIGARTQIGPHVQILTADHPRDADARAAGVDSGRPIVIGADVWIGGGAIILPGVTIGDGAVVGAGAVVTRPVPAGVTVAGNPARPLRLPPPPLTREA